MTKDKVIPPLRISEATSTGYILVHDGECFDWENPKSLTRRGRKMGNKSNCLMAKGIGFMRYKNARIRRFTPTECARLQTIPNWYKFRQVNPKTGADEPTSDTQIYKMLGNGWTVEVIKHFFRFIPLEVLNA